MKRILLFSLMAVVTFSAEAAFRSLSVGGATGLITTPSARVGWENTDFGFDAGAHYIYDNGGALIPKGSVSLFNRWEVGGTWDGNGDNPDDNDDILVHTKLRFLPWSGSSNSALAIGGNYQNLNGPERTNGQVYLAASYSGQFFSMPAETSLVVGKTFGDFTNDGDIDFSMGFELDFFPQLFKGYMHMLVDFANYSYSRQAVGANTGRGIFNTGFRLDVLKAVSGMSLKIDALLLDAMDDGRDFGTGVVFGMVF